MQPFGQRQSRDTLLGTDPPSAEVWLLVAVLKLPGMGGRNAFSALHMQQEALERFLLDKNALSVGGEPQSTYFFGSFGPSLIDRHRASPTAEAVASGRGGWGPPISACLLSPLLLLPFLD